VESFILPNPLSNKRKKILKYKNLIITLYYKVLFMSRQNQLETLQEISDIKRIMERSSRFISLSGLSGIAAGLCALAGAYFANNILNDYYFEYNHGSGYTDKNFESLKVKLPGISGLLCWLSP
jgi:hypothetical protein